MGRESDIAAAIVLLSTVPGFAAVGRDLSHKTIRFDPTLSDRGQAGLTGAIILGPEPFAGDTATSRVAVAATLVHEQWHTRQNPFAKTVSFWRGVLSGRHPMRRYEWPAYRQQITFLEALAAARPDLAETALHERTAVLASFRAVYGEPPV